MLEYVDPLSLSTLVTLASETPRPLPQPEEVKAGYVALLLWLGMGLAVAFLGWSLIRQLRRTQEAKQRGVFGEDRVINNGLAFEYAEYDDEDAATAPSASEAPEGQDRKDS